MTKSILGIFIVFAAMFMMASTAIAAPNNAKKAENNPQVVAYYPLGLHAIPTDPITYLTGTNLVMTRGNSGQIQAWYTGEDGHGVHSVWNISKNGTCPANWILIEDAYPTWGDYLTPGADYCVHTNTF